MLFRSSSAPFTFVFKFLLAWVAGRISHGGGHMAENRRRNLTACICGALTYAVLYVGKNFVEDTLFLKTELETALIDAGQKGVTSLVNAAIAVILFCSVAYDPFGGAPHPHGRKAWPPLIRYISKQYYKLYIYFQKHSPDRFYSTRGFFYLSALRKTTLPE